MFRVVNMQKNNTMDKIEKLKSHIREVERHLKNLIDQRNRCHDAPARQVFDMAIQQKQDEKKESMDELKKITGLEWWQIEL